MRKLTHRPQYDYRFLRTDQSFELPCPEELPASRPALDYAAIKRQIKLNDQRFKRYEYPPVSTRPVLPKKEKFLLQPLKFCKSPQKHLEDQKTSAQDAAKESFLPLLGQSSILKLSQVNAALAKPCCSDARFGSPSSKSSKQAISSASKPNISESNIYQLDPPSSIKHSLKFLGSLREISPYPQRPTRNQQGLLQQEEFYRSLNPLMEKMDNKQKVSRKEKQNAMNKLISILQGKLRDQDMKLARNVSYSTPRSSKTISLITPVIAEEPRELNRTKRIRIALVKYLNKLLRLNLSPRELMATRIFSKYPHEKEHSTEFFSAIKANEEKIVLKLLQGTRHLVYDFDNAMMTGLHWAAKRGHFAITKLLLQFNSDVDALDIVHRTPLFLAAEYGHFEIVQLLLAKRADPWSNEVNSYGEILKNPSMKAIFAVSRWIHIRLSFSHPSARDQIWARESQIINFMRHDSSRQATTQKEPHELLQNYVHLIPRLQHFYDLQLSYQLKKKTNEKTLLQEMDKKIQKDLQIFYFLMNSNHKIDNTLDALP